MAELQAAASAVIGGTRARGGTCHQWGSRGLTLGAAVLAAWTPDEWIGSQRRTTAPTRSSCARTAGYDHAIRAAGARIGKSISTIGPRAPGCGTSKSGNWRPPSRRAVAVAYMPRRRASPACRGGRHGAPSSPAGARGRAASFHRSRTCADSSHRGPIWWSSVVARPSGAAGEGILCGANLMHRPLSSNSIWMCDPRPGVPRSRICVEMPPRHSPSRNRRGFKVSKEEIVGLLVALERFVALDHAARGTAGGTARGHSRPSCRRPTSGHDSCRPPRPVEIRCSRFVTRPHRRIGLCALPGSPAG